MEKKLIVRYEFSQVIRITATLLMLFFYNCRFQTILLFLIPLLILGWDETSYDSIKDEIAIAQFLCGCIMYVSMLYIIFPKVYNAESIFWFIVGVFGLKQLYIPTYIRE